MILNTKAFCDNKLRIDIETLGTEMDQLSKKRSTPIVSKRFFLTRHNYLTPTLSRVTEYFANGGLVPNCATDKTKFH